MNSNEQPSHAPRSSAPGSHLSSVVSHLSSRRATLNFLLKAMAVIIPALITSYFSYRSAKVESDAHASAGYDVMLKSVEKLSTVASTNEKEIARLQGRVDAIQSRLDAAHPLGYGAAAASSPLSPSPPVEVRTTVFKRPLPANLDRAYQMRQQAAPMDF